MHGINQALLRNSLCSYAVYDMGENNRQRTEVVWTSFYGINS